MEGARGFFWRPNYANKQHPGKGPQADCSQPQSDSYLAGATVLHRADDTPRFSQDLDFFHDIEDLVAQNAEKDAETLLAAGYTVAWQLRTPAFHRAVVTLNKQQLKLEWAQESAFRFFPVQEDERCGYRLHDADAATNKLLALAGRDEIRDFVDILHLHDTLPLSRRNGLGRLR